ncbi:hypothetical protein C8F04DRAFT_1079038 [Mycena alexandri]|uniref:Uncharacterized protein n=1 Tax=Mycena alexandri TaxID=1745969 RepID=A0AAD6TAI8_9AGAR|nr:hypothetical protein C8F04DRAFT_1079038 [Mycena alexandri]
MPSLPISSLALLCPPAPSALRLPGSLRPCHVSSLSFNAAFSPCQLGARTASQPYSVPRNVETHNLLRSWLLVLWTCVEWHKIYSAFISSCVQFSRHIPSLFHSRKY